MDSHKHQHILIMESTPAGCSQTNACGGSPTHWGMASQWHPQEWWGRTRTKTELPEGALHFIILRSQRKTSPHLKSHLLWLKIILIFKIITHVFSWLFATPWTVARPAPLSLGLSRHKFQSGLSFPPPGDLPNPGIEFFITVPLGKPLRWSYWGQKKKKKKT